jgi:hypothetical protein
MKPSSFFSGSSRPERSRLQIDTQRGTFLLRWGRRMIKIRAAGAVQAHLFALLCCSFAYISSACEATAVAPLSAAGQARRS